MEVVVSRRISELSGMSFSKSNLGHDRRMPRTTGCSTNYIVSQPPSKPQIGTAPAKRRTCFIYTAVGNFVPLRPTYFAISIAVSSRWVLTRIPRRYLYIHVNRR